MQLELIKQSFIENLKVDNYAEETIQKYESNLRQLFGFLETFYKVTSLVKITKPMLESFIDYLLKKRSRMTGKKYTPQSVNNVCGQMKVFFGYLIRNDYLLVDYTSVFDRRRKKVTIFKNILSETMIKKVMNLPDDKTYVGFRDRVILELMYNTGLRRREVTNLEIYDFDFEEKTIFIRQSKHKKDRYVPMGNYLAKYIKEYVIKVRPIYLKNPDENKVFMGTRGEPLGKRGLQSIVAKYSEILGKHFNCHTFRHSFATHMLKHGAGLIYIQHILGHANPSTTEIYTRVYPRDLKKIILEKHPRSTKQLAMEEINLPIRQKKSPLEYVLKNLKRNSKMV